MVLGERPADAAGTLQQLRVLVRQRESRLRDQHRLRGYRHLEQNVDEDLAAEENAVLSAMRHQHRFRGYRQTEQPAEDDIGAELGTVLSGDELADFIALPNWFHQAFNQRHVDDDSDAPQDFLPPQPSCFLQIGQVFDGKQRVNQASTNRKEHWGVTVTIQGVDMQRGYACGTMEAYNVSDTESPIVTFWEGEIIDNVNHSFVTAKWDANRQVDEEHWSKFAAFQPLKCQVDRYGGRCSKLHDHPYIFMRWKEQFFVDTPPDCRLTIAGFYYVCLNRSDGTLEGYYHDKTSSPHQRLELKPVTNSQKGCPSTGYRFAFYDFR